MLMCLFVAAFCWFMLKMSKTYDVSYTYDVSIRNLPEGMEITYQSDSVWVIELENKGLALLGTDLRSKKLALDYNTLLTDYQKQRNLVHLQYKQLIDYLKTDRRFEKNIKSINISAFSFRIEKQKKTLDK